MHGWEVAHPSTLPWVTVPRKAKVTDRRAVHLVYGDLTGERVVTGCTRTVVDCARRLPFPDALAVADSALRRGDVDGVRLVRAAAEVRGKGAADARRVAHHADAKAANPFESVLRGLALEAGLDVEAQGEVTAGGRTLRFTHFQVMQQPEWVVSCLRAAASGMPVTGSLDLDEAG